MTGTAIAAARLPPLRPPLPPPPDPPSKSWGLFRLVALVKGAALLIRLADTKLAVAGKPAEHLQQ